MKLTLEKGDREILRASLGLDANASTTEIANTIHERLTGPAPAPAGTTDPDAEAVIAQAVRDGKFSDDRASVYRERWARDPVGTRRTIARLAANVVRPPSGAGVPDGYPAEWLRTASASGGGPRAHSD